MLKKKWFMLLAVRISSYGCTWEVCFLSALRESTQEARVGFRYRLKQLLRFFHALQTSRVHP